MQYETGQGKTALCLGIALKKVRQGFQVVILNSSSDLTFRDHKKASLISSSLDIQITRLSAGLSPLPEKPLIIFADENEFLDLLTKGKQKFTKNRCLIIDEFDSVFFEGENR
jgi:archaellum biogenesis ATPase FlaH